MVQNAVCGWCVLFGIVGAHVFLCLDLLSCFLAFFHDSKLKREKAPRFKVEKREDTTMD
jgi:hypothetical protein